MNALDTLDSLPPLMSFGGALDEMMACPEADVVGMAMGERTARLIAKTDALVDQFTISEEILRRLSADISRKFEDFKPVDISSIILSICHQIRYYNNEMLSFRCDYESAMTAIAEMEKQARKHRDRALEKIFTLEQPPIRLNRRNFADSQAVVNLRVSGRKVCGWRA